MSTIICIYHSNQCYQFDMIWCVRMCDLSSQGSKTHRHRWGMTVTMPWKAPIIDKAELTTIVSSFPGMSVSVCVCVWREYHRWSWKWPSEIPNTEVLMLQHRRASINACFHGDSHKDSNAITVDTKVSLTGNQRMSVVLGTHTHTHTHIHPLSITDYSTVSMQGRGHHYKQ